MYSISIPNLCDLCLLLYSKSPSTRPLARAYSKLAKITYKGRNQMFTYTMEVLWILAVLQIRLDDDDIKTILESQAVL